MCDQAPVNARKKGHCVKGGTTSDLSEARLSFGCWSIDLPGHRSSCIRLWALRMITYLEKKHSKVQSPRVARRRGACEGACEEECEPNPKPRPKPKTSSADVAERGVTSIGVRSGTREEPGTLCSSTGLLTRNPVL